MSDQLLERFWDKVEVQPSGCWNWLAQKLPSGYGRFRNGDKKVVAHRFAYEVNKGSIPKGLTLDHLCRNTSCVNPDHLEAVTLKENILRSDNICAREARRTTCPRGHPYSHVNKAGSRRCRVCDNENIKIWKKLARKTS